MKIWTFVDEGEGTGALKDAGSSKARCELNLKEAAALLALSYRQCRRLFTNGSVNLAIVGLVHRSRGRPSNRGHQASFKSAVLARYQERYPDFEPTDAQHTDAAGRVKKALRCRQRRQLVSLLLAEYRVSERRAGATVFLHRSVYRYLEQPRDDRAVRQRLKEIAETRVRYGFARIHILLRREGWRDNHKRTYCIYKEEGLNLGTKRPRRNKTAAHRQQRPLLTEPSVLEHGFCQ